MDPFRRFSVMKSEDIGELQYFGAGEWWWWGVRNDRRTYFGKMEQARLIDGRDVQCEGKRGCKGDF